MPVTINGTTGISTPAVTATTSTTTGAQTAGSLEAPTVTQSTVATERIQQLAAVNTTSGTFFDFNIPSWAKKVTLNFSAVSTNGSAAVAIVLGTGGGLVNSGYAGAYVATINANSGYGGTYGSSFAITANTGPADVRYGSVTLSQITGTNTWVISGTGATSNSASATAVGGSISLAGALDRVRLTTSNGTDVFDSGVASILIEG